MKEVQFIKTNLVFKTKSDIVGSFPHWLSPERSPLVETEDLQITQSVYDEVSIVRFRGAALKIV